MIYILSSANFCFVIENLLGRQIRCQLDLYKRNLSSDPDENRTIHEKRNLRLFNKVYQIQYWNYDDKLEKWQFGTVVS